MMRFPSQGSVALGVIYAIFSGHGFTPSSKIQKSRGPVTEGAFARWRIIIPSCEDIVMS